MQTELTEQEQAQAIHDAKVKKAQKQSVQEIDAYLRSQGQHPDQAKIEPAALFSFATMLICATMLVIVIRIYKQIKTLLLARSYAAVPSVKSETAGH